MKANPLGAIVAESDEKMLNEAFYETPDFKTIIEDNEKSIVVGRRGTGKSAIFSKLKHLWSNGGGNHCVTVAPQEDQIIGIRYQLRIFGTKYTHIRAASQILWKYALIMEALTPPLKHYKAPEAEHYSLAVIASQSLQGLLLSKSARPC